MLIIGLSIIAFSATSMFIRKHNLSKITTDVPKTKVVYEHEDVFANKEALSNKINDLEQVVKNQHDALLQLNMEKSLNDRNLERSIIDERKFKLEKEHRLENGLILGRDRTIVNREMVEIALIDKNIINDKIQELEKAKKINEKELEQFLGFIKFLK